MSSKRKRIIMITIRVVLAIILTTVAILIIVGNSKKDKSAPTEELSNWQSMIIDQTRIKDMVIAGAHDAGTAGLPYFAATQDRSTIDLLECGTRYLDLRVSYAKGKLLIYHGPSKGVALADVLDEVKQFITAHNTENVILDFQHFDEKDTEAQLGAIEMTESVLDGLLIANDTNLTDVEFIDTLTLEQARGKCLVVWGRENKTVLNKSYVFKRNNDGGTRTDSVIHSYYTGSLNKKSSSKYISVALPAYIDKYKEENCGLFVLQGQLTDGLFVFGPQFREATHTDKMNKYLDSLKQSDDLQYINIVIRDFISPAKNCHTIQLNMDKGVVDENYLDQFGKMIGENM